MPLQKFILPALRFVSYASVKKTVKFSQEPLG